MATARINGVRYELTRLTEYELDALIKHAENRATQAAIDIAKLRHEQERRGQRELPLRSPWGVDDPNAPPPPPRA